MHTKGPWIIDPDGKVTDLEGVQTIFMFGPEGQGYGRVAMVYAECGREDELEPNARLIAAAPELWQACNDALFTIRNPEYVSKREAIATLDAILSEAIRKAKGEQHE